MNLRSLTLLISVASFFSLPQKLMAELRWVDVGVNGLTCSMCSRSVEMSINRLNFVDSVSMSLEKTEGRIYIKRGAIVDLKKIAKAVTDAGFSVRFLQIAFNFDSVPVDKNGFFTYQGQSYQWLQFNDSLAKGDVSLKLVDEGFLPGNEKTKWKNQIGNSKAGNQNIFHVVQEL